MSDDDNDDDDDDDNDDDDDDYTLDNVEIYDLLLNFHYALI
jgi:hypothetical protein